MTFKDSIFTSHFAVSGVKYTLACGKIVILPREVWDYLNENEKAHNYNILAKMHACEFCPAGKKMISECRFWSPKIQVKEDADQPKRPRGRPKKIIGTQKKRGRPKKTKN